MPKRYDAVNTVVGVGTVQFVHFGLPRDFTTGQNGISLGVRTKRVEHISPKKVLTEITDGDK